jgi:signal transduction histidine kinase
LFGLTGLDPLVHAMLWSMVINTGLFLGVSLATFPSPMERLQGAEFVNVFENASAPRIWSGGRAEAEDLLVMAQRILGTKDATSLFSRTARLQEKPGYLPDPTPEFLAELERKLAGSVGAGTAHAMIAQVHGGASISVADLMAVADETAQIMEYSTQLEAKSGELQMTAQELRRANEKLTQLAIQKDAFLSQISHELRTPMTSIRAFSEILLAGELAPVEMERYARIIQDESIRLTRLLDDLLDLSVLEHGQVTLDAQEERLGDVLDRAVAAASAAGAERNLHVVRDAAGEDVVLKTDTGRLAQVFINLVSNAAKYCDAERPMLTIISRATDTAIEVDFVDNGAGIPADSHSVIFEKFARLDNDKAANSTGGAGLGLAISREIMERLGGEIAYLADQKGAAFRVTLPISGSVLRPVTNAL